MNAKVIFVDIDGPMISVRAYLMLNQTKPATLFDPIAAQMLKLLLDFADAKIVIASTWRTKGRDRCVELLEKNGIDQHYLHDDWAIDENGKFSATRGQAIGFWLKQHPEVTHWATLDDENMREYTNIHLVFCDTVEGMLYRNYMEALLFLDVRDPQGVGDDRRDQYEQYVRFLSKSSVAHVTDDHEIGEIMAELFPDDKKQ